MRRGDATALGVLLWSISITSYRYDSLSRSTQHQTCASILSHKMPILSKRSACG